MTIQTEAIYEGRVLRPLALLDLKEHDLVSLSITTAKKSGHAGRAPGPVGARSAWRGEGLRRNASEVSH